MPQSLFNPARTASRQSAAAAAAAASGSKTRSLAAAEQQQLQLQQQAALRQQQLLLQQQAEEAGDEGSDEDLEYDDRFGFHCMLCGTKGELLVCEVIPAVLPSHKGAKDWSLDMYLCS